ncbi:hypothetical protein AXK60_14580 [Tsukamurella pseudospumae]|uniref:Permease n=2 Tax=Tsukamurella pseudospumae TaxID=239498 RepID=A0A137ZY25_9ACTN|nr:hypothetical protein AXK61_19515 [Tsukamurella pseudospumae]KXP03093.1 hypothetical protein AXK60_14580 [Tsukamurella pseudospumae]
MIMTTPEPVPASAEKKPVGERAGEMAKKGAQQVAIWVGVAVVAVIVYSIAAAVIPRWWAQRVGEWVNKSMLTGTGLGLTFGILCTLIPLLLLVFAVKRIRRSPKLATAAAVLAVVVAVPNLMTASIAAGISNAAKAGRDVMNVDAPMFRGATLWGAIIGLVLAIAIPIAVRIYGKRREARKLQKAADKAAVKQAKIAAKEEARAEKAAARTDHESGDL